MKKNYFTKNLLAASMLLAVSMSMVSCQGFIDAIFGDIDNPVEQPETKPETKPEVVVTISEEKATIDVSALKDVLSGTDTEAFQDLIEAIEASATAKKEYVIEVKSDEDLSVEDLAGLQSLPIVKDAEVKVVIDQPVETSEDEPLKISYKGAEGKEPAEATNKLTVTMPDGTSDVYVSINMPTTTVTLGGNVTYKYIESCTAINSLYVESGVTIDELLVTGGRVIVKDGGVINTYVWPAGKIYYDDGETPDKNIYILYNNKTDVVGAEPAWISYKDEEEHKQIVAEIADEENNPYLCKNLKVIKGEESEVEIKFNISSEYPLEKLTIGDGVTVLVQYEMIAKTIEGEGNAKVTMFDKINGGLNQYECMRLYLTSAEKVSNIIFTEPKNISQDEDEYISVLRYVPGNLENCTFPFDVIEFDGYISKNGNVIKNCKFKNCLQDVPMYIDVPAQDGNDKFDFTFASCEFAEGTIIYPYIQDRIWYNENGYAYMNQESQRYEWVATVDEIPENAKYHPSQKYEYIEYDNYNVLIGFDKCKLGGAALTYQSDFAWKYNYAPDGVILRYVIDGKTYELEWNDEEQKYIFVEA